MADLPLSETLVPLLSEQVGAEEPQVVRTQRVITSTALSRPMVLQPVPKLPTPSADGESVPPSMPEPDSDEEPYADALAAVYAQAGLEIPPEEPGASQAESALSGPYTPEGVVAFLSALPEHLSQESCYVRMEEELSRHRTHDPAELVGDAAVALVALRQELSQHTQEQEESSRTMRWRIELLESELARLRELLMTQESDAQQKRQELLVRIDEMTGVIVFFDGYQSYLLRRSQAQSRSYEAPEFPDEETALRLLTQRDDSGV